MTVQVFKALYAFYSNLLHSECEHRRITASPSSGKKEQKGGFCPDCGYKILLLWTIVRCRTCGSKRLPKKNLDGRIAPLYRYCQHCGQTDYQIIKRDHINVHEMMYAISTKEIDYSEQPQPIYGGVNPKKHATNPFESYKGTTVVEGEVLRKEYVV